MKNLLIASLMVVMSACVVEEQGQTEAGEQGDESGEIAAPTEAAFPTSKKQDAPHEFLNCRWRVECRYDYATRLEECCDRCYSDSGQLLATGACTLRVSPPRSNM